MGLIDRAKKLITQPRQEWSVIDAEPATVGGLYTGYVIPLSLARIIAFVIGAVLFGGSVGFIGRVGYPIGLLIRFACGTFITDLVAVYVFALIIDALAPTFGGTKGSMQALKVSAYSLTAVWVFGILAIIPVIGWIGALIGLIYSIYLLYLGLPILMKAPADKAAGYTVVAIIAGIVVFLVIGWVLAMLGLGGMAMMR